MRRLEGFLAIAAVLLGLCCLVIVAAGLTGPDWVAPALREFLLSWAPLITVGLLGSLAVALRLPSSIAGMKGLQGASVIALIAVGSVAALWWLALRGMHGASLMSLFRR